MVLGVDRSLQDSCRAHRPFFLPLIAFGAPASPDGGVYGISFRGSHGQRGRWPIRNASDSRLPNPVCPSLGGPNPHPTPFHHVLTSSIASNASTSPSGRQSTSDPDLHPCSAWQ